MAVRFGTDGIRGVANSDLSAELVLALGRAVARVLPATAFLVGRDTRRSGPLLQAALSAGLAGEGADVIDVGVLPTPGVAWLSARRDLPAAMVSASHNPFGDNGVKVFAAGGLKLPDQTEEAVEAELEAILDPTRSGPRSPTGRGVGVISADAEAASGYVEHLVATVAEDALAGMRIVVDCANGAASYVAGEVFRGLGADVEVMAAEPDGVNINDECGSTHPEALAAKVVGAGADLGLALDGDADRLVAVDHVGNVATGDELLALFAVDLAERGQLAGNTVVVTVMSNLGLHRAMAERGINVARTPVGDRAVLEALDAGGLSLGGEQSGHLVFRRLATTGDGLLTGLLLADLVRRRGRPFAELVPEAMQRVPQLLVNITVPDPDAVIGDPEVLAELEAVDAELADGGRALLRASGTEPLVRVMVEAVDSAAAHAAVERLQAAVERAQAALAAAAAALVGTNGDGDIVAAAGGPGEPAAVGEPAAG